MSTSAWWALFWSLVVVQLVSAVVIAQWLLSIAGTDLTVFIK
jgi:hypothetical protein